MDNIFSKPVDLIKVDYDSPITDLIIDLEHLRRRSYGGSTPVEMFLEIKALFHLLESLGSARLEGNRTAIAEIIEENINPSQVVVNEKHLEVRNIENALQYIDSYIQDGNEINAAFIREIHKRIVKDLTPQSRANPGAEGDPTPGAYRRRAIVITDSELTPPASGTLITSNMALLIEFINKPTAAKYDLIKTALVHHRFTAIHPFNNGNGRTVRALTYAMLLQQEFSVAAVNRILNPTAIFCNDRSEYIKNLAIADKGTEEGLSAWCKYMITGLKDEIEKIDHLTDYKYIRDNILFPAVASALEKKSVSEEQAAVLKVATHKRVPIMSKDIAPVFSDYSDVRRTRLLNRMVELKLIRPIQPGSRKYVISFSNSYLLRDVVERFRALDFIPSSIE